MVTVSVELSQGNVLPTARAKEWTAKIDLVADELEREAPKAEVLGKLSDRTIEILRELNISAVMVPEEIGGPGLYPAETLPILERLAYIDGSLGWLSTIFASSGPLLAYLDPAEAKALLSEGEHLPLFAASGAPNGKATPVDGGYRFSGSYSYSSGGLHADWVFCSGFVMDGDKPQEGPNGGPQAPRMFLVSTKDVVHGGNWDTIGLRGTGSVDFTVEDVFVPANRAIDLFGKPALSAPQVQGGFLVLVQLMHLSFACGISRRILDEIAKVLSKPSMRNRGASLSEDPRLRVEFAEFELAQRAARAFVGTVWAEVDATLAAGEPLSRRLQTLLRGANIQIHNVLRDVSNWAYRRGGGTTLRQGTVQRAIRDAWAGTQHAIVDDSGLIGIGQELFGVPEDWIWAGLDLAPAGNRPKPF